MKTVKNVFYLILIPLLAATCIRDYEAPPIPNSSYEGEPANITIGGLREIYASTMSDAPSLIEPEFIIKVVVTGNDVSGNIYKQLYVKDSSGAINIGIDQNSIYATLRVGQELFIHLRGMSIVNYGGELQIGYTGTNANRIPWEIFEAQTFLNDWPDTDKAQPLVISLNSLTTGMVNQLVRLDNVYFVNGGTKAFTSGNATTNEALKDGDGNTIDVRTSSYASFANDLLPSGSGSITGLLGRYNGSWQFTLRSLEDVMNFGGAIPGPSEPDPGDEEEVIFYETFGTGTYPSDNRPKIASFTDFDMKSPIAYSDASGNADIRSISGNNGAHVWFPANRNTYLTITGIDTSGYEESELVLTYEVAANLYDTGSSTNLNAMRVSCNGVPLSVPDKLISNANGDNAVFFPITLEGIPSAAGLTLEFFASETANNASETANNVGLRLDNIKIATKSSSEEGTITPKITP